MSLIIKGMDMPYCCVVCPFKEMYNDGLLCKATKPHQYIPKFLHKRNEKCPLTELPTPHGRLIDCESKSFPIAFGHELTDYAKGWNACLRSVLLSPTIIEAEVSE